MAMTATVVSIFVIGVPHPKKALLLLIAGSLGIVAGVLQLLAISAARHRFLSASTALGVRKAMTASKAGLGAILLVWISAALLLFVTFTERGAPVAGAVGAFAAFIFVREAITLKRCYDLEQSAQAKTG